MQILKFYLPRNIYFSHFRDIFYEWVSGRETIRIRRKKIIKKSKGTAHYAAAIRRLIRA